MPNFERKSLRDETLFFVNSRNAVPAIYSWSLRNFCFISIDSDGGDLKISKSCMCFVQDLLLYLILLPVRILLFPLRKAVSYTHLRAHET